MRPGVHVIETFNCRSDPGASVRGFAEAARVWPRSSRSAAPLPRIDAPPVTREMKDWKLAAVNARDEPCSTSKGAPKVEKSGWDYEEDPDPSVIAG